MTASPSRTSSTSWWPRPASVLINRFVRYQVGEEAEKERTGEVN